MKKILTLSITLILGLALVLTSCNTETQNEGGYCTFIAGEEIYEVPLEEVEVTEGALSVLKYLKSEGVLDFTYSSGDFGAFLTKVGEVEENAAEGKYVGVWTSVSRDFDVSVYATEKEYEGVTLVSAGVGVNQLTVTDGAVICFDYIIYE